MRDRFTRVPGQRPFCVHEWLKLCVGKTTDKSNTSSHVSSVSYPPLRMRAEGHLLHRVVLRHQQWHGRRAFRNSASQKALGGGRRETFGEVENQKKIGRVGLAGKRAT